MTQKLPPPKHLSPLDTHQIAKTADQIPTPSAMRATDFIALFPMGDLIEEDIEIAISQAGSPLPVATDDAALQVAEALQAKVDALVEATKGPDVVDTTDFFTRRRIKGRN